eukprot:CAMPEP_0174864252 /NCGR_PEP_ID=MMETSP1114-20130205/58019_1 /TAXON_ID=312471 /ORGANISM="Neobodo designis, Strain CCAP 1951/1" /LENGTH=71 /DNA_ID=CAMNT_0016099341 /DNA_START=37 /DNA_END=249 /DNA_ORIENTATION=+
MWARRVECRANNVGIFAREGGCCRETQRVVNARAGVVARGAEEQVVSAALDALVSEDVAAERDAHRDDRVA